MRYISTFLFIALSLSAIAQSGSSKNKKANEYMGKALLANDILDYEEALSYVDKALKKDERFGDAWQLKGDILQKTERYDEAKVAYQQVLSLEPNNVYAILEMGRLHLALGKYEEAIGYLKQLENRRDLGRIAMEASQLLQNARFGAEAVKNPVPFEPTNLGPNINTKMDEYFPGLTVDEKTLFFTRNDGTVSIYKQNEDLFISNKEDSSWGKGYNIGEPVNTPQNEGAFSTSPDSKFLFYTACGRPGGQGGCDIWYTKKDGNKWLEPRNIGSPINTHHFESQPSFSSDGVTLYFSSNRPGGYGGDDIWVSRLGENGWSVPVNLGPEINTPYNEEFPFIHPDNQTLYFTSTGHPGMGGRDIFYSRKTADGTFGEPINLGYPINGAKDEFNFIVNRDGTMALFSSESQEDSYGGLDIYSTPLYPEARPIVVSYVKGIVYDSATGDNLFARISLTRLSDGKIVSKTFSDPETGTFLIPLPANNDYAFKVTADKYAMYSANFSLEKSSREEPYLLDIPMQGLKVDVDIVLENIFFETNKSELLPSSKVELESFVEFLSDNESLRVEISGHTDNVGSDELNEKLSKNRAKSVYDYLVEQGIDEERLTFKGYGASQPRATNETEKGRALNRRTSFKIIGL